MYMKKILLLGGSSQQIIAIETAKKMGFFTIVCDYLPDNPGQNYADKFYLVSTTDKKAILEIAKNEKIDGIISYASDPAAPTAAYVSEKLGLTTNPYNSVDILCNKDKFRKFLKENNFNTPCSKGYQNKEEALNDIKNYNFPIIIKPVDSSGSKGVTILKDNINIINAIDFAFEYSRSKRIIIEEFIEKNHKYLIGGDIFVVNGKVKIWGLLNCHRNNKVNPLVPIGKSYPLQLDSFIEEKVKYTLQKLVDNLKIKNGAMNVELIVDKNNKVWPIDIGPRNGGNMIPDLLGYIFGINIVEMSINTALGLEQDFNINIGKSIYATHNLHTEKNGKLKNIIFSDELEKFIIKKSIYKNKGDEVSYFSNSSKALGIIFLEFKNQEEMSETLDNIMDLYEVEVE